MLHGHKAVINKFQQCLELWRVVDINAQTLRKHFLGYVNFMSFFLKKIQSHFHFVPLKPGSMTEEHLSAGF